MTAAVEAPAIAPGRVRGMASAIAAISIFAFGVSLTFPLFSILLERMGASGTMIGLNGASAAAAILLGGLTIPAILRFVSLPLLMISCSSLMAALILVFPVFPDPWVWLCLRFFFGFAAAGLFVSSEIWIVSAAPPARRGLAIGVYGFFLALGFLAGPLLLKALGTDGLAPFYFGAAISLCAIPPVIWAWRDRPDLSEDGPPATMGDVLRFFRTDPSILWAVFLFGVIEFGAMGLFPVWSIRAGGTEQAALTLVALLAAGNLLLQVPLGWIGDRFDRRLLLAVCAAGSTIACGLFPLLSGTAWPLWVTTLLWGGLVVGLYTFSLNELGSRYQGADLARGTGSFAIAYGMGALVAPPLLGAMLDLVPPHGMFLALGTIAAGYLALLLRRIARNPRPGA